MFHNILIFMFIIFQAGLQEENWSRQEGIFEGPGSLPCELSVTSKFIIFRQIFHQISAILFVKKLKLKNGEIVSMKNLEEP